MQTYPWPSNVSQMHRLMEQVMLSLDGDRITADAIKAHLQEAA
jgi:DNA-binding NtrC family response regulator